MARKIFAFIFGVIIIFIMYYIPAFESFKPLFMLAMPVILVTLSLIFRSDTQWIFRYLPAAGILLILGIIDIGMLISFPQGEMAPGETYDFGAVLIRILILFLQNIGSIILLAGAAIAVDTIKMIKA